MSLEEFKKMDASQFPIGKLISMISRAQEIYLNHQLKNLDINNSFQMQFQQRFRCKVHQETGRKGIDNKGNR